MESLNIIFPDFYTYAGSVCMSKGNIMQDNQNQTHWIYSAAIMDSDGCFMIARKKLFDRCEYLALVKIAMINNGSIEYILKNTGLGYTNISGVRPSRPRSLPLYEWRITKRDDLIVFLKGILPYLQNKRDRAEFLLEYCNNSVFKPYGKRHIPITKEELDYRERSYQKMRELNDNKVGATTKS